MVSHSGRKGSGEQLSDSRATVWEILLTRVFTLRTLSAGDVKGLGFGSDRIYCPPCPQLLSTVFLSACSVINVLNLDTDSANGERGNKPLSDVSHATVLQNETSIKRRNRKVMTQVKALGDSRKRPPLPPH